MKKKIIAMLVVVAMVLTLSTSSAFAGTTSQASLFGNAFDRNGDGLVYYVAIGDSIAAGYGLNDGKDNNASYLVYNTHWGSPNAYPAVVADRLAAYLGYTAKDRPEYTYTPAEKIKYYKYYQAIDGVKEEFKQKEDKRKGVGLVENENGRAVNNFSDTSVKFDYSNLGAIGYMLGDFSAILKTNSEGTSSGWSDGVDWGTTIRSDVELADIITIHLGGNDMLQTLLMNSQWGELENNPLFAGMLRLMFSSLSGATEDDLGGYGEINWEEVTADDIAQFLKVMDPENISKNIQKYIQEAADKYLKTPGEDNIITQIKQRNPHARIVLVGQSNPYKKGITIGGMHSTYADFIALAAEQVYAAAMSKINPSFPAPTQKELSAQILGTLLGSPAEDAIRTYNNELAAIAMVTPNVDFVNIYNEVEDEFDWDPHPVLENHKIIGDKIADQIILNTVADQVMPVITVGVTAGIEVAAGLVDFAGKIMPIPTANSDNPEYAALMAEAERQQALIDAEKQAATTPATLTTDEVKALVESTTVTTRTEITGRGIRVYVNTNETLNKIKDAGYTVLYDFYSVQQAAVPTNEQYKLTKVVNKEEPWYLNTAAKMGNKYYYKAVVKVLDKDGNEVATTTLDQAKYGSRTMAKFVSTI